MSAAPPSSADDTPRPSSATASSDALLRSTFRATSEGVVVQLASGAIVDANPAAERILGLTLDQLTGRTSLDPRWRAEHEDGSPFPGDTHPAMVTLRTGEAQRGVIMAVHKPSGERTLIRINSEPIPGDGGAPAAVVTTFVDVTEFHQAEARLLAAIERADDLYNRAPCGYHSLSPDGLYVQINDTELEWLGVTREEVVGKLGPADFMGEAGKALFGQTFPGLRSGTLSGIEHDLFSRTGAVRRVSVSATAVRDTDGRLLRSRSVMYDITELARVRAALQAHAGELEAMLDNDLAPILRVEGRTIRWLNRAAERLLGYERHELIGHSTRQVYPDDTAYDEAGRDIAGQLARGPSVRLRRELRRKDGGLVDVDVAGITIGSEQLFFATDLTAIRAAERHLMQSQKMESVGRLAGGIAHELNNALQTIGGTTALLRDSAAPGSFAASALTDIETRVDRAAALLRHLITYAGRHRAVPARLRLDEPVARAVELFRPTLPLGVNVEWQPGGADWQTLADPALITQAVTHLLMNAGEAIRRAGTIRVRTGAITLGTDDTTRPLEARPGEFVFVEVADDGSGMTAHVLRHACEPFFTTRPFGDNHGLGLAIVYGIATQAGGWITLRSVPAAGTTATLVLPRTVPGVDAGPAPPTVVHVLVVDDDPSVRRVSELMAVACGYRATGCGNGAEALALLRDDWRQVDVVVTAPFLADIDAAGLHAAATALRPSLAVVCMSSDPVEMLATRGALTPAMVYLARPFKVDALRAAIERARASRL